MRILSVVMLLLLCQRIPMCADNLELISMLEDDQASRRNPAAGDPESDQLRRERVFQLLAENAIVTPADKLAAAVILQHTSLIICNSELASRSVENYLLANQLARSAWQAGEERAQILVAQTLDRYLCYTTGQQKYGTQRFWDDASEQEVLFPIDPATPDSARLALGLDSLAVLLRTWPMKREQP